MRCIGVAFLLLSSVSVAVCAGDRTSYLKHAELLKQYPCGDPQPRVFELEEIINKDLLDSLTRRELRESIKPAVTVLYRCESSGCCKGPLERCMAVEEEDVTLTFAIVGKSIKYHQETVTNHRKCECRIVSKEIK